MSDHVLSDFVTLTYREDTLPEKLDYEHVRLFLRRYSYSIRTNVRYFVCGEYGGKTNRPHWHVLLFGARLQERGLCHIDQWPYGHVYAGDIEAKSAQYVCRYTLKSAMPTDKKQVIRMSRRPGIGLTALRRIGAEVAKRNDELSYYPPVVSYMGKKYWLDRHAYQACVDAYMNAGGALSYLNVPEEAWTLPKEVEALPIDAFARKWMREVCYGAL